MWWSFRKQWKVYNMYGGWILANLQSGAVSHIALYISENDVW